MINRRTLLQGILSLPFIGLKEEIIKTPITLVYRHKDYPKYYRVNVSKSQYNDREQVDRVMKNLELCRNAKYKYLLQLKDFKYCGIISDVPLADSYFEYRYKMGYFPITTRSNQGSIVTNSIITNEVMM